MKELKPFTDLRGEKMKSHLTREPLEAILKRANKHLNFVDVVLKHELTEKDLKVTYLFNKQIKVASFPRRTRYSGLFS